MPLLTIVIPLYNKEASIGSTLNSVISQINSDVELLIINDGSTDMSMTVVENITTGLPNVRVLSQENCGVSAARNLGIKEAKSNYIAFLDADDVLKPGTIDKYLELVDHYSECVLFCFGYEMLRGGKVITQRVNLAKPCIPSWKYFQLSSQNRTSELTTQSSIIINKSKLESIELYKIGVTHSEDLEFCARVALLGNIYVSNHIAAEYHLEAENRSSTTLKPEVRYIVKSLEKLVLDNKFINTDRRLLKYLVRYIDKHRIHSLFVMSLPRYKKDRTQLYLGVIKRELSKIKFINLSCYYKLIYLIIYTKMNLLALVSKS